MNRATITAEQFQAIQDSNGLPVYFVDEAGRDASLAIVPVCLLKILANDDFNIAETYAAQEAALSKIWGDPALDAYTDQDGSPIH